MEQEADFFMQYKAVSNKLKKRFLKKPNVAEAREEFGQLASTLSMKGCYHYAGFCCLAMARCEMNMSHSLGEVQALTDAARYFLQADQSVEAIHSPKYGEHLICAKSCFDYAIKVLIKCDLPCMAASLCEEIGRYYEEKKDYHTALSLYLRGAELNFQNPLHLLLLQQKIMILKTVLDDFNGALSLCSEILHQISDKCSYHCDGHTLLGQYAKLHCDCEIQMILLLMLLNPHPLKIVSGYSQILQKYTWTCSENTVLKNGFSNNGMDPELFTLMQSFVMACSGRDLSSMEYLQSRLRFHFTPQQNMLLQKIIEEYNHPAGLGF
ncbi:40-kDa huntingtin-associated protein-like [Clavelina lepadiformis]|uniref:40-kDa huntingtin-associated protein-like n=1 Tax=Clavelina lepadiformis TaxID=159417 RepID=UPI004042029E